MSFLQYWFMFPVSIAVATTAMLSGIGGAAFFMPVFLIVFPLLGPEYVLAGPAAAVAVALLTETFGFSSGFVAYVRKRLIDFRLVAAFAIFSVPAGIAGSLLAHATNPVALQLAYGLLMVVIAYLLIRGHHAREDEACTSDGPAAAGVVERVASDGRAYRYTRCRPGPLGAVSTGGGGFLAGLLSVGIGEVIMPQLVRAFRIPVPVAAATSIAIVIVTIAAASFTHIATLVSAGGLRAVPWELVAFTIPGVIIGGQIGPRLHGRMSPRTTERTIGCAFAAIALAMFGVVLHAG